MANLGVVLKQLETERDNLQRQIKQLDSALSALGGLNGAGRGRGRGRRRKLSPAARNSIAAAQRKRWATWRTANKKK